MLAEVSEKQGDSWQNPGLLRLEASGYRQGEERRLENRKQNKTKPNKESGLSLVTVSPPLLHSGGGVGDVLWRNYFREGPAWDKRPGRK